MSTRSTPETPPGPAGLPLIGTALESKRALSFLLENRERYGDIVAYRFLNETLYQLNHPDDIESVLVSNNQAYKKSHLTKTVLGPVVGEGLFTSDGDTWRTQRRRIQPAFHPDQITDYAATMAESTARRIDSWTPGDRIELNDEMRAITLDIVARSLLGVDIQRDIDDIGRCLDRVFDRLTSPWYHLLPAWAPTPGNRRFRRALESLEAVVDRIIDDRADDPSGGDVVSRLLDPDHGEPMGRHQLREEVMTFLVAGHETTAQALTFTNYLLATHPEIEARLVDELDSTLGDTPPTAASVNALTYLERVVRESLRLFPPASDIHREPIEPVQIRGYPVQPGVTLSMPPWVVHRDPRWYPAPDRFHPGRWSADFRDGLPRLAYFPFGAGPRRCVGDRFALLELSLVLTSLYQRVGLELDPETTFEVESAVTLRPKHPIWMTVTEP